MKHNEYRQMIQLSLYSELSEEKQKKLISHLETCEVCRQELEHQKNLMKLITDSKNLEVDEDLLKEARLALGAISVLIIGLVVGSLFLGREKIIIKDQQPVFNSASLSQNDLRVSNLQFIDSDPADGEIEFTFDASKQIHYKGSVNNPEVQNFLTYAILNDQNAGSRLNSINVMDNYKKTSLDREIKNALITVVMTDKNTGVRREALKLLNRSPFDESTKQAYLFVLLHDSSSALRIEALNALIEANKSGHSLNRNDLDLVIKQASLDDNSYIKLKSKTLLEEYK